MKNYIEKDLVIFGVGKLSKIISSYFQKYTEYKIVAYIDNYNKKHNYIDKQSIVLSPTEFLENYSPDKYIMFIAVGYSEMNKVRTKLYTKYKKLGYSFVNFIHPNVEWWDDSNIGENSFIFENNVVQQNVSIGNNVIMWSGNHIGHDARIGDNVWITSHVVVYSNVNINNNCFIGSNANLRDGISIGYQNFIGAGTNIWSSTKDFSVFAVEPSKPLTVKSDKISSLLV